VDALLTTRKGPPSNERKRASPVSAQYPLAALWRAAKTWFIRERKASGADCGRQEEHGRVDEAVLQLSGWIFLGSGLGGVLRFLCSGLIARAFGETFPWGTLLVNVTGSFLIGLFAVVTGPDGRLLVVSTARQSVMVGIFGGYTTFSSFSLQTLNLARDGQWGLVAVNIILSLVLCLGGVWLGFAAGVAVNR
jgi:fluoride exporter